MYPVEHFITHKTAKRKLGYFMIVIEIFYHAPHVSTRGSVQITGSISANVFQVSYD